MNSLTLKLFVSPNEAKKISQVKKFAMCLSNERQNWIGTWHMDHTLAYTPIWHTGLVIGS